MDLHVILTALVGLIFAVALVDACLSDLRHFRIANRDSLAIAGAFALAAPAAGMDIQGGLIHAGAAVLVFAVATFLYTRGVWGGGDVKLVAAVALMTGFAGLSRFLMVMTLVGGGLAIVALVAKRWPACLPGGWGQRMASAGHVPYGIAIAAGGFDWMAVAWVPRLTG